MQQEYYWPWGQVTFCSYEIIQAAFAKLISTADVMCQRASVHSDGGTWDETIHLSPTVILSTKLIDEVASGSWLAGIPTSVHLFSKPLIQEGQVTILSKCIWEQFLLTTIAFLLSTWLVESCVCTGTIALNQCELARWLCQHFCTDAVHLVSCFHALFQVPR